MKATALMLKHRLIESCIISTQTRWRQVY